MKHINKVEAYFDNELSETEKQDFLKELESNSELKSEFDFQNEIINGIKEARKAELKAMLNKVPIAASNNSSAGLFKILASTTTILITGTALWYYFNYTPILENNNASKQQVITTLDNTPELVPNNSIQGNSSLKTEGIENTSTSDSNTSNKKANNTVAHKINMPDIPSADDEFTTITSSDDDLRIPANINQTSVKLNTKVDVEIKIKKKYNFHYQFTAGKLTLYGEFEGKPFEVLELNSTDNRDLYLLYNSNYYSITDKSGAIAPLLEVKDVLLKQKLKSLN